MEILGIWAIKPHTTLKLPNVPEVEHFLARNLKDKSAWPMKVLLGLRSTNPEKCGPAQINILFSQVELGMALWITHKMNAFLIIEANVQMIKAKIDFFFLGNHIDQNVSVFAILLLGLES